MKFKVVFLLLYITVFIVPTWAYTPYGQYSQEMIYAKNLLDNVKPQQAIAIYAEILKNDPNHTPALLALGSIYLRQAKYVEAEKVFLRIINANPNNANGYERLAHTYYQWSQTEQNPMNKDILLKAAVENINKSMKIESFDEEIHNTAGLIALKMGDYSLALSSFNKALDINPSSHNTYTNLGILYRKLRKYDVALQQFQRSIDLKSDTPRAYKELAKMLNDVGQYRQAITNLKKSRFYDIFVTFEEHYLMASMYEKLGMSEEAIKEYQQSLVLKPDSATTYVKMAELYETSGNQDDEIAMYQEAVKLDYSILQGFLNNARTFLLQEEFNRALPLFKKVMLIEPTNNIAFEGYNSLFYLESTRHKLDQNKWYQNKSFLDQQEDHYKGNMNIKDVSIQKFLLAGQGMTPEIQQSLLRISRVTTNTPQDLQAKGEALFLLQKYQAAHHTLLEARNAYLSLYEPNLGKEATAEKLMWYGDTLYFMNELLASREVYDAINELMVGNLGVQGLERVARQRGKAETMLAQTEQVKMSQKNLPAIENRLNEVIRIFPQSAQAHFILSELYAKTSNDTKALEELLLFIDLAPLTPYPNAPNQNEIQKRLEKYNKDACKPINNYNY